MYFRKGSEVRVKEGPDVPSSFQGQVGVVRGHRPDGFTVVEFPNQVRRPFKDEHLEPAPPAPKP